MGSLRIFVLHNEQVTGPYTETELDQKLSANEFEQPLLWWRGQAEWLPPRGWRERLQESQEKTTTKAERLWKVRTPDKEFPEMTQKQMIEVLKDQDNLAEVRIWTEGYDDWKEVFQIHPIMDELGVSRRQHPRVPLTGTVTLDIRGTTFEASPRSISEGGIGLTTTAPIKIGNRISVTIRSPQLYAGLTTSAEVMYLDSRGSAGLRFEGLNSEGRAAIIEYVKRFTVS